MPVDTVHRATPSLHPEAPLTAQQQRWVDSTLAVLSLREQIAQMVMVWVLGNYSNAEDSAFAEVVRDVAQRGVGGVVMSLGSPLEVASKVQYLQARATVPLLVASDLEPGLGRLEGGVFTPSLSDAGTATVLPTNMAIAATGDEADAEEAGRITGREAHALGIHVAFAPTADVNNNPANPVINTRAFGEDPAQVARLTEAFVRGVQREGTVATLKHFPGHGDTDVDSHLGLPVLGIPRARLDSVELVPFRAGIAAGAAAVMTAHIALPGAYGDSVPATLSPAVMTGLLRDTLAFRGVTFTDALTMDAIATRVGIGESAVRAVRAGDDVLLMPLHVDSAVHAVEAAVRRGDIPRAQITASVRRLLRMKAQMGLADPKQVASRHATLLDSARATVGHPDHWRSARRIAQRAITLLRADSTTLPVRRSHRTLVLVYAPENEVSAGRTFSSMMQQRLASQRVHRVSPRTARSEFDSLRAVAATMDRVVVYSYTRTLEGAGRVAIPRPVAEWVEAVAAHTPTVVVAGGNPYQLRQFPSIANYLVTYGRGTALEEAAARAVLGDASITGRTPVTLPGLFARGDGLTRAASSSP